MPKINIDKKIIESTKCDYDFFCLKDNEKPFCKVEYCVDKVCFINTSVDKPCSNKIFFGESVICNCPVRIEIFRKYNI